MAIVKMRKLSLAGLSSDKQDIIEHLMRLGVVDINDTFAGAAEDEIRAIATRFSNENTLPELDEKLSMVKSAIRYLSKYNSGKKGLFSSKAVIDTEKYNEIIKNQDELFAATDHVLKFDERISVLKSEINRFQNLIDSMQPWKGLDVNLSETGTKSTHIMLGTVSSAADVRKMENDISENAPESYFELLGVDRDLSYFVLIYHLSAEAAVSEVLKQYGFSRVSFKDFDTTASGVIKETEAKLKEIEAELKSIGEEEASLAGELNNLQVLFDHLTVIRDKTAVLDMLAKTDSAFLLEGWLPEEYSEKVTEDLKKIDCYIDIRDPFEGEDYPILLKNNAFVRSFEIITELFSLPNSREVDPSAVMSIFYFVFFGMMVSDAGYGLLLAILTGILLFKYKPEGMLGKMLSLLFYGGISTFIWGAMFGGWFGDIVDVLSGKRFTIPPVWFNPLNDPMRLLIWSFIFGAIHLFAGMGIKGYMLIKSGKFWDALFDVGFWYLFLLGLGLLFAGGKIGEIGKYMAISGAILLILTQGRSEKNIIKKFFSGVLSLYNAVGFMSDVFSYSRLLALGLATGVISSVINTIGTLMGFTAPGIILIVITFVIGHTFNLVINALGAYVHASRLQYVEFFGKFYEGGGKPYTPFKINTKYTRLNDRRIG